MTDEQLKEIFEQSGWRHAEFCLEQAESQKGKEACKEARIEFERLIEAMF